MTIYLVRHAKAGARSKWTGPDELRPLSKVGRRQASGLVDLLLEVAGSESIAHVVSSPSVRCRQTVEPLAERLQRTIDPADALAEGARLAPALRLVEKFSDTDAVLCMHGDVLPQLLNHFAANGLSLPHDRVEKGSTWALDFADGEVASIRYFPPPE